MANIMWRAKLSYAARAILINVPFRQHAMDWHQCDDMCYHLFFSGQQAEVWFYVLWANFLSLMHFSGSLFACFLLSEGGSDCLCIRDEYARMISGLRLLSWQLKSPGNSLNCHGKVMELYYQISVGTLHTALTNNWRYANYGKRSCIHE